MWFKNLQVFRLTKPLSLELEKFNEQLEEKSFTPATSQEPESFGWVSPLGRHSELLYHINNQQVMLCAKRQTKILPASVVKEKLEDKVAVLESEEDRKLSRKEKQALKEEITFDLLPKAFSKSSTLMGYISLPLNLVVINSSSAKAAEDFLSLLRDSLGSLPVIPLTAKNLPLQTMTSWIKQQSGLEHFILGNACEFKDLQDNGSIKCKEQDLSLPEIVTHLEGGMQVVSLELYWQDKLSFTLTESLILKSVKYLDFIQDQLQETHAESVAEQFDVDFSIMSAEVNAMIQELLLALGGEVDADRYQKESLSEARAIAEVD